jgi:hypothetical protein
LFLYFLLFDDQLRSRMTLDQEVLFIRDHRTDLHRESIAPAGQRHDVTPVFDGFPQGELPPFPDDSVGEALWINDQGQAVGSTGSCANTTLPPLAVAPHAVLWENGSPVGLGNLGGACVTLCFSELLGL